MLSICDVHRHCLSISLTIRCVARDELIHRSGALATGEALLVVNVTHRNHLLGFENLIGESESFKPKANHF